MKYIEEILLLNNSISEWNLIFYKFDKKVKFLLFLTCLPLITLFIIFLIGLFPKPELKGLWPILPMFIIVIIQTKIYSSNCKKVIRKYYSYANKKVDNWNKTMLEIRKKELKKILDNKNLLKKENLIFLIESIKYHQENKHKFGFLWNTIIILASVYLGGLITGQASFYENKEQFESHYGDIAIAMGMIILVALVIDNTMIKEFFTIKFKSKKRMLMTLENIYIEKYAT